MKLSETERTLLTTLDDLGATIVSGISRHWVGTYARGRNQMRSGAISSWLRAMERQGLVRRIDDGLLPHAWAITPAGRAALEASHDD